MFGQLCRSWCLYQSGSILRSLEVEAHVNGSYGAMKKAVIGYPFASYCTICTKPSKPIVKPACRKIPSKKERVLASLVQTISPLGCAFGVLLLATTAFL